MQTKRIVLAVASAALAAVMLFACLFWLPMVATDGASTVSDASTEDAAGTEKQPAQTRDATTEVPNALVSYNFKDSAFDSSAWTIVNKGTGSVTVTQSDGLTIPYGLEAARAGYAIANPLKGSVSDGFTIVFVGSVTEGVNDYESILGFNMTADPYSDPYNCWFVASSGTGVHLNINDSLQGTASGTLYYDITGNSVLSISNAQFIVTVSETAITIYLNGQQKAQYTWSDTWSGSAYSYDTLSFVNRAEYFNLGIASSIWGNAGMTAQYVSLYDSALTAEQIEAMNANLADFTTLNEAIAAAEAVDSSNYDTSADGWDTAYATFTDALSAAKSLAYDAAQTAVDTAAETLSNATAALEAFRRTADLTDSLVAAYPLSSDGKNIVDTNAGEVLFMNGSATSSLSSENNSFGKRIAVTGAKLYADENLADREMLDTSATPTTGLKIPSDAFSDVSTSTGMTITVSVYAYNFYRPYGRIFQFGTKSSSGDGASGAQLYLMVSGGFQMGNTSTYLDTVVGTYIAGEWITVSLVFAPEGSLTIYMSSNTSDRVAGGISSYTYTNATQVQEVLNAIINGQDNWIGRSYWSADGNLVGLASNLSVYNRALMKDEVVTLHQTSDLSTLVTAD